jgi:hypothetical protein
VQRSRPFPAERRKAPRSGQRAHTGRLVGDNSLSYRPVALAPARCTLAGPGRIRDEKSAETVADSTQADWLSGWSHTRFALPSSI